jgi:hypothetical protein
MLDDNGKEVQCLMLLDQELEGYVAMDRCSTLGYGVMERTTVEEREYGLVGQARRYRGEANSAR